MDFLHSREYLDEGDTVVVDCSHKCNILLMDDSNFQNYKSGRAFRYHGGHFEELPARITAPSSGHWNITIDIAGASASIRHSINIIPR